MANAEHLAILKQGVKNWNQWRKENPDIRIDLRYANLSSANLSGVNLRHSKLSDTNLSYSNLSSADLDYADLSSADLRNANLSYTRLSNADLSYANLSGIDLSNFDLRNTNLSDTDLSYTNLSGANISDANLHDANLSNANLSYADLSDANLSYADLSYANLNYAVLSNANLSYAVLRNADLSNFDLSNANLSYADLRNVNFRAVQALATSFSGAILTGACIEDWNINAQTNLQGVKCDCVYLGYDEIRPEFCDRRPHDPDRIFEPGDFAKLVLKTLNTVDLIFREGLDWQAFAYSFRQIEVQYGQEKIAIHSIENRGDGTVIVKLAVAPDIDKTALDKSFWHDLEIGKKFLTEQYEARLEDKDQHINQLFRLLQQSQEKLGEVLALMAENPKNIFYNTKFGGGATFGQGAPQIGGTLNDFSQHINNNLDDIAELLQSLRQQAEIFPGSKRDDVIEYLNDLEEELQHPEKRKPSRLKATLGLLFAIAIGLGGAVATATDFANNVLELSTKLNIPIEQIQQIQP